MNSNAGRHVGVVMPPDLHRRLVDAARSNERTISQEVRLAVRDRLATLDGVSPLDDREVRR